MTEKIRQSKPSIINHGNFNITYIHTSVFTRNILIYGIVLH